MKEEALKLADDLIIGAELESQLGRHENWADLTKASDMIRKLVAELDKQGEPVAWGMPNKDGNIYDVICPEEHDREEGSYTIPLYTAPQTKQCKDCGEINPAEIHTCSPQTKTKEEVYNPYTVPYGVIEFANHDNLQPVKIVDDAPQTKPLSDEEIMKEWQKAHKTGGAK